MDQANPGGVPQFSTAEFSTPQPACKSCSKALGDEYYQVNGHPVCASCANAIKRKMTPDSHAALIRGILFGSGGALLGFLIYVGFTLATGLMVGYVSLAVGFLVGKAILTGSGGRGGRRYQIAALVLTYMAVSMSAVPIMISQSIKHRAAQQHSAVTDNAVAPKAAPSLGKYIAILILVGLGSPFLALSNPVHGLIGLVILGVGIRIAWRMTAGKSLQIVGPIRAAALPAAI